MSILLAYFDPGSGSLLMQVLVGGGAGLIVLAKYLWNSALVRSGFEAPSPMAGDSKARTATSSGEIPVYTAS